MSSPTAWYQVAGAIAFGAVIGWTAHFILHRTKRISIASIATLTAALGGGEILRAFGGAFPFVAVYCLGLAAAYFSRAFLTQAPILKRILGEAAGDSDDDGLNSDAWDLLATLWKFQKQCCGADAKARWQMAISPGSADFADFASGFARARKLGYVDILAGQVIQLSTGGYQFCQQNEKRLGKRKRLFFVET
jgi:hypothetical protein